MNERLKMNEIQKLMDVKATIVELSNSILVMSQGLWAISSEIDSILMDETHFDVQMEHTDPEPDPELVRARGRPRKESIPEPLQAPARPQIPPTPPQPPTPPKPSATERLLGKDADERARIRTERMKELAVELEELNRKRREG